MDAAAQTPALRILVLVDRDWTHPQTGGNGVSLIGQVGRWAEWGHHVTVICGEHPGAPAYERFGPNLEVHRMGTRTTVFPRAILAVMRGLGRDADVVLEIVNGITWLTPLWLTKPRVVQILHVHRGIWEREYPDTGLVLHQLLEVLPLRLLYRGARFMTISGVAADEIAALGLPRDRIDVQYCGVDPEPYHHFPKAAEPRLVFVGRLKAYKGVERVMDVLDAVPGATLDVVGDGDHLPDLEQEVVRRRFGDRVRFHGYVDDAEKARLYGEAWLNVTASNSEGWSLTVIEAALCGTPSAALAVGGLKESIVPDETGLLADTPEELVRVVAELLADPERRQRFADAAERRAKTFTWDATAAANLATLEAEAAEGRAARVGSRPRGTARRSNFAVLAVLTAAVLTVLGARR